MAATSNSDSQVPGTEGSGLSTAHLLQQDPAAQAAAPEAVSPEPQEEDAIAAYMAELLQRNNPGGAPVPVAPAAAPAQPPQAAVPAQEPVAATPEPRAPVAPPERRDDLAVMRELANSNAKNALEAYSSSRMVKTTKGRFQIAAMAVVLSITLALFSQSATSLPFLGSIACLAIAALWTSRYLVLVRHLRSLHLNPAPAPPANTPPQPAADPQN